MSLRILMILPAIALAFTGCATTSQESASGDTVVEVQPLYTEQAAMAPAPPQIPAVLNSVEFTTPRLGDRVAVTNTTYERTPGRAFRVLCTLRNLTDKPVRLQARTQYFADDRTHQEGPGAWELVFLPPHGLETYISYSYGTNLSYYFVEVQEL